jgi:hypothetical protein
MENRTDQRFILPQDLLVRVAVLRQKFQDLRGLDMVLAAQTISSLNVEIMEITLQIHAQCPELLPFLNEMPLVNIDNPTVTLGQLSQYNDSLHALLEGYQMEHPPIESVSDVIRSL